MNTPAERLRQTHRELLALRDASGPGADQRVRCRVIELMYRDARNPKPVTTQFLEAQIVVVEKALDDIRKDLIDQE